LSLVEFLSRITRSLDDAGIPFMLTGSLAAAFYGTPRATQDVDLVIDTGQPQLDHLLGLLLDNGLYVSRDAAAEAFKSGGQFNAIDPATGWKADLIFRRSREFSRTEFDRRRPTNLFGVEVALPTVEDLIIAKLEWSVLGDAELQRRDILDLLDASEGSIDRSYMQKWIAILGLEKAWADLDGSRRG
jgi:hypothetical protein